MLIRDHFDTFDHNPYHVPVFVRKFQTSPANSIYKQYEPGSEKFREFTSPNASNKYVFDARKLWSERAKN